MSFFADWVYRWKHARALLHIGNAWYYMFRRNIANNHSDAGDKAAEDILQGRFWEMYTGKPWVP